MSEDNMEPRRCAKIINLSTEGLHVPSASEMLGQEMDFALRLTRMSAAPSVPLTERETAILREGTDQE